MNVNIALLNQLFDNFEILKQDNPMTADNIALCNCYIEHLLAKIIEGYEPKLYYNDSERLTKQTDLSASIQQMPELFYNFSSQEMPIPRNTEGYFTRSNDNLEGKMGIYYDEDITFSETEAIIRELCKENPSLTEDEAFYLAYPKATEEDIGDVEDIEEAYEDYQAYLLINDALWNQEQIADEELVADFLADIPEKLKEIFQKNAPLLTCAYINLVFTLLYESGDAAYNYGLYIQLHYSDSILSFEAVSKKKEYDKVGKEKLDAYSKALQLMSAPRFSVGEDIQSALDLLNSYAPKGTCFLLTGRTDQQHIKEELHPDSGFFISAITADLLAEEMLSEFYFKKVG